MHDHDSDEGSVYKSFTDLMLCISVVLLLAISIIKSKNVDAQAEYLASIEWDSKIDADVDLLAEVKSEEDTKGTIVYYSNKSHKGVYLDRDSRGFSSDRVVEKGETIYLPHREVISIRGDVSREITLAIHLFGNKTDGKNEYANVVNPSPTQGLNINVHFELLKVNPTAQVIFKADKKLNSVGDSENLVRFSSTAKTYNILELPINSIVDKIYQHGTIQMTPEAVDRHSTPTTP